jgi:transporter family-2 protein
METLLVPASLLAGGLLALQAGANAQLSKAVASPFAATTLQLFVAALLLGALAACTGGHLAVIRLAEVPWWHVAGGTASAFYVVSTILLFPRLGAVVSVGLFIAGQMLASTALDTFGALGVPAREFGAATIIGTLAVLGGAAAIVLGQREGKAALSASTIGWIGLALAAGAVLPIQGAVNALLRVGLGAPFTVGAISFVVATLAMAAVLLAATVLLRVPPPDMGGLARMPWWAWLGGFVGATYVTTVFMAIPEIGTAATVGLTIAGQQAASVLVDRYGWFRLPRRPLSALRLAGAVVLLAGVAIIKMF